MTRDGDFKRLVRARMDRAGESYTTARARFRRRGMVAMTRRELETLPDAELATRCAEPLAQRMRAPEPARHAFLRGLTGAQGALLAFWILFAHAEGGLRGFVTGFPHRMVDDDFWTLLEAGQRRLGDAGMLALLRRLRSEVSGVLTAIDPTDLARLERVVEAFDRLDPAAIEPLDDEYRRLLPGTLRLVARLIRDRPNEFVVLEA
jgi:hypothetical protein